MLLAVGQPPKVISEALGYATVAFTMDVYTEVAEDLRGGPRDGRPARLVREAVFTHCRRICANYARGTKAAALLTS